MSWNIRRVGVLGVMRLDIHIYDERAAADAQRIHRAIGDIMRTLEIIMHTLDETLALVEKQKTTNDSLVSLLVSIKRRLDDALGGQLTPSQQMRVDAIFNGLQSNIEAVNSAVIANTDQQGNAGGNVETGTGEAGHGDGAEGGTGEGGLEGGSGQQGGPESGGGQKELVETRTTITSSLSPIEPGQTTTISAGVEGRPGGSDQPLTGSVTFKDGETVLATANLDSTGVAAVASNTFAGGNLSAGNHSLTAEYSGDANYAPSASDPFDQVVTAPNAG